MINSQEWLDKNYPKEKREKITELDISKENLEGELDLSDFISLKRLYCYKNKLTSLNVNNCSRLEKIRCRNNLLFNIITKRDFGELSFKDQQKFLISLLDKNLLYVPYCDMEDKSYKIEEGVKKSNYKFYEKK